MIINHKTDPDAKYKMILSRERSWARSVARSAIKERSISVWEVMIPIIFIFNFMQKKNDKEIFIQNLLFTKELALKAALDMMKNGRSRGAVISSIEKKTRGILAEADPEIYSEEIRLKQLGEIELLIDHYRDLLQAEGRDFDALVMNAYQNHDNYTAFLVRLHIAEKEVGIAAMKTLGTRGDAELVSRMEEAMNGLRMASAERIFSTGSRAEDAKRKGTRLTL